MMVAVMALAMITASGYAGIGDSFEQFENPKLKPTSVKVEGNRLVVTWAGKKVTHVGTFERGKAIIEVIYYTDHRPMKPQDFDKFLKPYGGYVNEDVHITDEGETAHLFTSDGAPYAVVFYSYADHKLCIISEETAHSILNEAEQQADHDQWRALPNETAWQWLKRNCQGKECAKNTGDSASGPIYWNWPDDRHEPLMDNFEFEPNEPLLVPYPFMPPKPTDPLYDANAEAEMANKTTAYPSQVVRFYRRGVFIGYKVVTPQNQPAQTVKI
jgi:hypothetical protein